MSGIDKTETPPPVKEAARSEIAGQSQQRAAIVAANITGSGSQTGGQQEQFAAILAAGLTKARRAMILALPADGSWGKAPSRSVAKRAWWNMLPGVINHKHCPEDANEWALSDFGLAVRAALNDEGKGVGE